MPRTDHIEIEGTVTAFLGGGQYEIRPDPSSCDGSEIVRAQLCGKMKQNRIRLILGDRVRIEVAPTDKKHGLVTWRIRQ
jgi:translation initiation factor IF-1